MDRPSALSLEELLCVRSEHYGQCLAPLNHSLTCCDELSAELRFHYVIADGDGEPKFQQLATLLVHSILLIASVPRREKTSQLSKQHSCLLNAVICSGNTKMTGRPEKS